jgi:hypothetical protein
MSDKRPMNQTFIVHHNPNNQRYRYAADPDDAIASASAMMKEGERTWVAGNCRRMIQRGDVLLFKFGGLRLQQEPGIYAAARVTRAPAENAQGTWLLRYEPDARLTRRLVRRPIVGRNLARIVPRSFGASIQVVKQRGQVALEAWLPHTLGRASTRTRVGSTMTMAPVNKDSRSSSRTYVRRCARSVGVHAFGTRSTMIPGWLPGGKRSAFAKSVSADTTIRASATARP